MNRKNAVSIAALLALLAFSVVAIGRQGVRWLPPADQRHAVLEVTDANGIATGSKLLLRGVPIGQVTAVRAAAERVEIEFGYRRNYRIPIDSDFRIESLSSLGRAMSRCCRNPPPDHTSPMISTFVRRRRRFRAPSATSRQR